MVQVLYVMTVLMVGLMTSSKIILWEIAVLDSEGAITYHTPVTQDVIGRANDDEVTRVLKEISELGSEYEKQLELKFGENND